MILRYPLFCRNVAEYATLLLVIASHVYKDDAWASVYVFDRRNGVFYLVDFNDQKWGGYSLAEYEVLERTHRLTMLAQRPWLLERRYDQRKAS